MSGIATPEKTRARVRARIIDHRFHLPIAEIFRSPGEVDRVESHGIGFAVAGDQEGGTPGLNHDLGEVEFPPDADLTSNQVWLPQTRDRFGPFALPVSNNGGTPRWFLISAGDILGVATKSMFAALGITVIRDDRTKYEERSLVGS